jgi:hypothetical protein
VSPGSGMRRALERELAVMAQAVLEAVAAGSEPRLIVEGDAEWLSHMLRKRYAKSYNASGTERWLWDYVWTHKDIYHGCRTRNAFCISLLTKRPWSYEIECSVLIVCCEEGPTHLWEALSCLRSSIEWGRTMRATTWKLASDTDYDLAPVARYLGLTGISPRFVLHYDKGNT